MKCFTMVYNMFSKLSSKHKKTTIHFEGHLAHVQCLVEAGADVHSVDQSGDQPIHKATKNGHNPVVIYLVTNGCQINNANNEGKKSVQI